MTISLAGRSIVGREAAAPSAHILLLGAAGALGSVAMHIIVPALPAIAISLHASPSAAQSSIGVYLVGLALGQLAAGGIADTLGRRPVLLGGVVIFGIASLLAAVSDTLVILLIARFFQALGGAAGLIAGRALVADGADEGETPRRLAALSSLLLISPTIAPFIGGLLQETAGWRAIFLTLAAAAILIGTLAWRAIPRTWVAPDDVSPLKTGVRLLANWSFLRLAIGNGLLSGALYAFLSVSPFLLINRLGLSPKQAGFWLLWIAACAIAGTLFHRSPAVSRHAATFGRMIAVLGGITFSLSTLFLPTTPLSLIAPMCLVTLGSGLSGPSILALAITVDRSSIGTASSIFGATQMALGAAGTAVVALFAIGDPRHLSFIVLGAVTIAFFLLPKRVRNLPLNGSVTLT